MKDSVDLDAVQIRFSLNGEWQQLSVPTNQFLLGLLREGFGLTSVRASCDRGVCGVCTVLVDDEPVAACSTFAFDVDGSRVETVEGQTIPGSLSPVQRAFVECGGMQCGFCTSGMVMLTTGLLRHTPDPGPELARRWISSSICRCTGYQMILESVSRAGELLRDGESRA